MAKQWTIITKDDGIFAYDAKDFDVIAEHGALVVWDNTVPIMSKRFAMYGPTFWKTCELEDADE